MKAFILAAGNGTRLRPLTNALPKCLLPIQGVPLLQIWLDSCGQAGIDEVLVNVHAHGETIRDFANAQTGPVRVHIAEEKQLLGSAGTLAENRKFLNEEEAFFVLYGDVLTNTSLTDILAFHARAKRLATIGIHQAPDPSQCGVVEADREGVVGSFVEKPAHSASNWAFSGIMIASPKVLDLVPAQRPADIGFHLLPRLIGQMTAYRISDYLLDIGTLDSYRAAQTSWPGLPGERR